MLLEVRKCSWAFYDALVSVWSVTWQGGQSCNHDQLLWAVFRATGMTCSDLNFSQWSTKETQSYCFSDSGIWKFWAAWSIFQKLWPYIHKMTFRVAPLSQQFCLSGKYNHTMFCRTHEELLYCRIARQFSSGKTPSHHYGNRCHRFRMLLILFIG